MDKTGGAVNITVGYRGLEIALADFISAQIILRGSVFLPPPDTAYPCPPPTYVFAVSA